MERCVNIAFMVTTLCLMLINHSHTSQLAPVSGNMEWDETPSVQQTSNYHPMLRFNPGSTFMIATPSYIAEGHYQQQDGHYSFRPELAIELGNADVDKLVADMDPQTKSDTRKAYAESLSIFDADYNDSSGILTLNYPVHGHLQAFSLYTYSNGDSQDTSGLSDGERGMVGIWSAPDPFPEKLDAKTCYRIGGLEGLVQFSREAKASDASQFDLLDLRSDNTFRIHSQVGNWELDGSTLWLTAGKSKLSMTLSSDGRKLTGGGKVRYTRG